MKKWKTCVLALACTMCIFTGCGESDLVDVDTTQYTNEAGIANPFVQCEDVKSAEKIAGFTFDVPSVKEADELINFYDKKLHIDSKEVTAIEGDMIQVIYKQGKKEIFMIRKGVGESDISGDYNDYTNQDDVKADGYKIHIKSMTGSVVNSTWTREGYSYCISNQDHPVAVNIVVSLGNMMK